MRRNDPELQRDFDQASVLAKQWRVLDRDLDSIFADLRFLGRGGFGIVFAGTERGGLKRRVAVKIFYQQSIITKEMHVTGSSVRFSGPGFDRMTERELRNDIYLMLVNKRACTPELTCYYEHFRANFPGLARLANRQGVFGPTAILNEPSMYGLYVVVSRLDEAISMQKAIDDAVFIGDLAAKRLLMTAALALYELHSVTLYHRDIRPANLLLVNPTSSRSAYAVLLDLGLACVRQDEGSAILDCESTTERPIIMGARDINDLGISFYHLLDEHIGKSAYLQIFMILEQMVAADPFARPTAKEVTEQAARLLGEPSPIEEQAQEE
jgi:serine/threonine protein kinase